ncbi:hypothetical protein LJR045_002849 [Microbacterium sp. LjRoot45]|uniref:MarR family winged helix-turn-helix transcriptional regulator n=1 Tax=Microbacterium sp. LjRoot45 TaxID=3342329 RepID=UPI003ED01DD8
MENTAHHEPRPIGYWLRATDRLISREFATAFETEGVTRREWMILNVLDGTVDAPHLADRIQRGGKKLRSLSERGWVAEVDGAWTLTDDGTAAKARLAETVDGIRSKVAGAVSDEDYATTVASLEAMARALGWDENTSHPHRGHGHGFGGRGFGPGRGFRPGRGFGPRFGERGFGPRFGEPGPHAGGCDDRRRGHDRREGGHHGHDHGHSERAYERGFDAGFQRGREAQSA